MTEGNPTVEEARNAIYDYFRPPAWDRFEVDARVELIDRLIEAVRQEERERAQELIDDLVVGLKYIEGVGIMRQPGVLGAILGQVEQMVDRANRYGA